MAWGKSGSSWRGFYRRRACFVLIEDKASLFEQHSACNLLCSGALPAFTSRSRVTLEFLFLKKKKSCHVRMSISPSLAIFKAAWSMMSIQSKVPTVAAQKETQAQHPKQLSHWSCALFVPNLIHMSGRYTIPPTGNVRLKLFVESEGWCTPGRKRDSTALDCFLFSVEETSILYSYIFQDF